MNGEEGMACSGKGGLLGTRLSSPQAQLQEAQFVELKLASCRWGPAIRWERHGMTQASPMEQRRFQPIACCQDGSGGLVRCDRRT